ncbi:MAG: DUF6066 family protein [Deltaproteobacteria bacterium]|nr:DUF6066 family protein [Deltaproteobacteria bacterium]
MNNTLLTALALPILLVAPLKAEAGGASFEDLKEKAEKIESLGNFLKNYVGVCKGDPFEVRDCRASTQKARQKFAGKLLHVRLSDSHGQLVQVAGELPSGALRMAVTPFFDAAGYGLCKDKAPKFDKGGSPRMRLLPFTIEPPEDLNRRNLELQLRSGNVKMELLFKVKSAWKAKRPGDEDAEGIAATFKGLRLTSARTGEVIGEVVW